MRGRASEVPKTDVEAVNEGILALTEAAENLQELDIQKMNDLIQSLERVSAQMEKTTSAFGKLFGK